MGTLMTEGGFPMFLVLAFGLATLLLAARFAYQPDGRSPAPVWSLAIVTVATAVTGVAADLAAVGHQAPRFLQEHVGDGAGYDLPRVLIQGFAESMAPAILGSTFVALAGLLIAVGLLRRSPPSRTAASQAVED
jgi:hypothetical protein